MESSDLKIKLEQIRKDCCGKYTISDAEADVSSIDDSIENALSGVQDINFSLQHLVAFNRNMSINDVKPDLLLFIDKMQWQMEYIKEALNMSK